MFNFKTENGVDVELTFDDMKKISNEFICGLIAERIKECRPNWNSKTVEYLTGEVQRRYMEQMDTENVEFECDCDDPFDAAFDSDDYECNCHCLTPIDLVIFQEVVSERLELECLWEERKLLEIPTEFFCDFADWLDLDSDEIIDDDDDEGCEEFWNCRKRLNPNLGDM